MAGSEGEHRARIADLERQIADLGRGIAVAARADGAEVTAGNDLAGSAIKLVLSEMRREVPYDSCSVQELRDTRLVIVGGVGFADLDVIVGESFDVDNFDIPNAEVIHRKRSLIVGDTEQYRAFRRGLHVGVGIRSWLGVPLMHDEQIVGMLALDKSEADFYTQEHAQDAQAYASIVAAAMLRARGEDAEATA
jgi:GAF domain-containing protein